jgi:hypothetical protein
MFDPNTPYESMNAFEQFLFDISDRFITWLIATLTPDAVGTNSQIVVDWLIANGGQTFAYNLVDFFDFIGDIVKLFS